ncbi:MAG: hydantoin racemase [Thermoprotei archaeon]|nr:MAG: hydantoin racemase [Thermoprotei archaeon]
MFEGDIVFLPMIPLIVASIIVVVLRGKMSSNYITSISSMISCGLMLYVSYRVLILNRLIGSSIWIGPKLPGVPVNFFRICFLIDSLSAIFVFILGLVGFLASLYSISYMSRFYDKEHIGFYGFNYMIFLLSMYLTLTTRDLFWFIIFWEIMTLSSQFLVSFEKDKKKAVWAGYKYFTITKAGSEILIVGILLLIIFYCGMKTDFLVLKLVAKPNRLLNNIIIALLFIGLAVKASLTPFHTWLPDAHPEAPSHVSALLGGVMIKIPIYMMFRLYYFFFRPSLLWGIIVSIIGIITVLIGAFYALVQEDSKRLLAYSSIENIGIIILGLGASLSFLSVNSSFYNILGALALFASLYHVVNHAICKSLLFLVAGSIIYRTGSRDLDVLGGLSKYMPLTALAAIIGMLSITGIPPFNGFISKWLLYSSTIGSGTPYVILGIILLFAGGLTIAIYIKFYTTIFTRPPKKPYTGEIKESPPTITLPLISLAILCIIFGLFPIIPWHIVGDFIQRIYPLRGFIGIYPGLIIVPTVSIAYPLLLLLVLVSIIFPILFAIYFGSGKSVSTTWASGVLFRSNPMSVSSRSYYNVFRTIFSEIYSIGDKLYSIFILKTSNALRKLFEAIHNVIENPPYMIILFLLLILVYCIILWTGWYIID